MSEEHTICLCELSGYFYVLTEKKVVGCEICRGGWPLTPENVQKAFRICQQQIEEKLLTK